LTQYVDSSTLLKRYLDEPDADEANEFLNADTVRVTARHTSVEVRRNLAIHLRGEALIAARGAFERDLGTIDIVDLDGALCDAAATIAESSGVRSLDALHLAAAQRVAAPELTFLTYDGRQARAARELGFHVVGVELPDRS
jgi:predicted nucleic acid-binding protein